MKVTRFILVAAAVVLILPGLLFAAKPGDWSYLAAPAIVNCETNVPDGDNVVLAEWGAVEGAVKYSVEVSAGYDTNGDCEPDQYLTFEYTSDQLATSLEFDLDDFADQCFVVDSELTCGFAPIEVSWKVKGLNPPAKRYGNPQNNPWSDWCEVLSADTCEILF